MKPFLSPTKLRHACSLLLLALLLPVGYSCSSSSSNSEAPQPTPAPSPSSAEHKLQFEASMPLGASEPRLALASQTTATEAYYGVEVLVSKDEVIPAQVLYIQGATTVVGMGTITFLEPARTSGGPVKLKMETTIPASFDKTTVSSANPLKILFVPHADAVTAEPLLTFSTDGVYPQGVKMAKLPPTVFQIFITSQEAFEKGSLASSGWKVKSSFLWTILGIPVYNNSSEAIAPTSLEVETKTFLPTLDYKPVYDASSGFYNPAPLPVQQPSYVTMTLPVIAPETIEPGETQMYFISVHPSAPSTVGKTALSLTFTYTTLSGEIKTMKKDYGLKKPLNYGYSYHLRTVTPEPLTPGVVPAPPKKIVP